MQGGGEGTCAPASGKAGLPGLLRSVTSSSDTDCASAHDGTDPLRTMPARSPQVTETFLRCVKERFDQTNAVIELNGLKVGAHARLVS